MLAWEIEAHSRSGKSFPRSVAALLKGRGDGRERVTTPQGFLDVMDEIGAGIAASRRAEARREGGAVVVVTPKRLTPNTGGADG